MICSRGCGRLLPLGVPVFYRGIGALSRDRKPVSAEKFGFGGVVGDKKDGFVIGDGAHRVHGGAAVCLVQPLERLVEHKQVRLRAERARERAPPPHPAGELRGGNGKTLAKAEPRQ